MFGLGCFLFCSVLLLTRLCWLKRDLTVTASYCLYLVSEAWKESLDVSACVRAEWFPPGWGHVTGGVFKVQLLINLWNRDFFQIPVSHSPLMGLCCVTHQHIGHKASEIPGHVQRSRQAGPWCPTAPGTYARSSEPITTSWLCLSSCVLGHFTDLCVGHVHLNWRNSQNKCCLCLLSKCFSILAILRRCRVAGTADIQSVIDKGMKLNVFLFVDNRNVNFFDILQFSYVMSSVYYFFDADGEMSVP